MAKYLVIICLFSFSAAFYVRTAFVLSSHKPFFPEKRVIVVPLSCDDRKCPRAPLTHYVSLLCTPEYSEHADICCPDRYNCDHLYDRISQRHNVCYINGNLYALGVRLRWYDAVLCEEDCICKDKNGIADFECKTRKECPPYQRSRPDCFQQNPLEECCPTEEICPNDTEERDTCTIYTKEKNITFLPGQYIHRTNMSSKISICGINRTDPTGKAFLTASSPIDLKQWSDVHAAAGFYNNCAPVYLLDEHGSIGLRRKTWRCEESGDYILHMPDEKQYYQYKWGVPWDQTDNWIRELPGVYGKYDEYMASHGPLPSMTCAHRFPRSPALDCNPKVWKVLLMNNYPCRLINPDGPVAITYNLRYRKLCKFGQMTMHIGDELNRIPYGNNSCIVCTCEVPPVPTCVVHQDKPCYQYMCCSGKDIINGKCDRSWLEYLSRRVKHYPVNFVRV